VSTRLAFAAALACLGLAGCQTTPPTHSQLIREHLAQLIRAHPAPCGAVQAYSSDQRLRYRVECQSGDVYGVGVKPDGRVSVESIVGAASAPR